MRYFKVRKLHITLGNIRIGYQLRSLTGYKGPLFRSKIVTTPSQDVYITSVLTIDTRLEDIGTIKKTDQQVI